MKFSISVIASMVVAACIIAMPASTAAASAAKSWTGGQLSSVDVTKTSASAKSTTSSAPSKSPTRAIKDLDAMLDDFKTGKSLTPEQERHNRELKMKIIHGTFDVRELSRRSLAKHWNGLTPVKRTEFVDLMVALLEEKALFSKEQSAAKSKQGGKYKVLYRGHKFIGKDKQKAFVRTKVLIPSENIDIDLNYKLKLENGEWKIYDVIVDEASLVSNYKFQFNSIIKKHGYDELVRRMTKKLDEIKIDRSKS